MLCSVCKYGSEYRYCETCGNDMENSANLHDVGVNYLVKAYDAERYTETQDADYSRSLIQFQLALKYSDTLPPVLLMVTFFQYAMSITKVADIVNFKDLPTPELIELTKAVEESQRVYDGLSPEVKKELVLRNYKNLFGGNLGEAYRVLNSRKTQQASSVTQRITPTKARISQPPQYAIGETNGDNYTFAYPTGAERLNAGTTGIRCVRCPNHVIPVPPCANCGNGIFLFGVDVFNATGLFCLACRRDYTWLTCVCGCQNPIQADTIMRLKGT